MHARAALLVISDGADTRPRAFEIAGRGWRAIRVRVKDRNYVTRAPRVLRSSLEIACTPRAEIWCMWDESQRPRRSVVTVDDSSNRHSGIARQFEKLHGDVMFWSPRRALGARDGSDETGCKVQRFAAGAFNGKGGLPLGCLRRRKPHDCAPFAEGEQNTFAGHVDANARLLDT